MIIKILEEMRQVRIDKDYRNYRTLTDILGEYINNEIFSVSMNQLSKEKLELVNTIIRWIDSELTYISDIVNTALKDKDYGNLKVTSQFEGRLQRLKNSLNYTLNNKYRLIK